MALTEHLRAAYLGAVFRSQPPERAHASANLLRQGTPATDWESLKARVACLA